MNVYRCCVSGPVLGALSGVLHFDPAITYTSNQRGRRNNFDCFIRGVYCCYYVFLVVLDSQDYPSCIGYPRNYDFGKMIWYYLYISIWHSFIDRTVGLYEWCCRFVRVDFPRYHSRLPITLFPLYSGRGGFRKRHGGILMFSVFQLYEITCCVPAVYRFILDYIRHFFTFNTRLKWIGGRLREYFRRISVCRCWGSWSSA